MTIRNGTNVVRAAVERSCPNASSDQRATARASSCSVLRSWPRSKESLSRHTFRSTSPAWQALLSVSTASSWVAAPPGPERRACGGVASRQARCGSRGRRRWPASKPISKQRAKSNRSANPGGAFHGDGQSPRRPRPAQQPSTRLWLAREPPRASTCRQTPLRRRSLSRHHPSLNRRS